MLKDRWLPSLGDLALLLAPQLLEKLGRSPAASAAADVRPDFIWNKKTVRVMGYR
jgi:hypothetical protein